MATKNQVNVGLKDSTGTGSFVGSTSPTIVTPVIARINDASGNEELTFSSVASAVNYIQIKNAATLGNPRISALGDDASVVLTFESKGGVMGIYDSTASTGATFYIADADGDFNVGFKAPNVLSTNTYWELPGDDGAAGCPLYTTGADVLAFSDTPLTNPNIIIGGDFGKNPWQRQVSFTAPTTGTFTADRFAYITVGTGVVDILKTADAPTVAQAGYYSTSCLHVDVTTADAAIAAGDVYGIIYRVEGYDIAQAGFGQTGTRYVTLSFWHKHTVTGTYGVGFRNSANNRSYVAEYTQDVADTWEKAEITVAVDTTGTWLYTNGIGLAVSFAIAGGSTFQTTAGSWQAGNFWTTSSQANGMSANTNNFKIQLVKLEFGQRATPFPFEDESTTLLKCQRYYQSSYALTVYPGTSTATGSNEVIVSYALASGSNLGGIRFVTGMRAAPTVTVYSTTGASANVRNLNGAADVAAVSANISAYSYNCRNNSGAGLTADNNYAWHHVAESEL